MAKAAAIGCGALFGAVWILLWSGVTLTFDVICVRGLIMQARASHYPSVQGKVTHSEVQSKSDGEGGTTYTVKVRYTYVVNDFQYEAGRMRYGMHGGGRKRTQSFVRQHPKGTGVTVYYNPANPWDAVLEPGVRGTDLFAVLFLTPFNAIMLVSWALAAGWLGKRRDTARRVTRRTRHRGATAVVRLPGLGPLGVGLATAVGLSFILVFVVGFATGMQPSLGTMVVVLAGVAGAAVWAGWRARNKRLAGFGELEVDAMRRSITLPMKKDQASRDVVSAERVEGIEIREVVKEDEESTTTKYVPTVKWRQRSGGIALSDLGSFDDRAEAEALRDWLGRELKLKCVGSALADGVSAAIASAEADPTVTASEDSGAGRTGPVGT